jgi:hypothetical protein
MSGNKTHYEARPQSNPDRIATVKEVIHKPLAGLLGNYSLCKMIYVKTTSDLGFVTCKKCLKALERQDDER